MWEPGRLTTLCAFTACYRDNFTILVVVVVVVVIVAAAAENNSAGATHIEPSASQSARTTAAPTPIGSGTVTTTYLQHYRRIRS
jgi:hypothetical protein